MLTWALLLVVLTVPERKAMWLYSGISSFRGYTCFPDERHFHLQRYAFPPRFLCSYISYITFNVYITYSPRTPPTLVSLSLLSQFSAPPISHHHLPISALPLCVWRTCCVLRSFLRVVWLACLCLRGGGADDSVLWILRWRFVLCGRSLWETFCWAVIVVRRCKRRGDGFVVTDSDLV